MQMAQQLGISYIYAEGAGETPGEPSITLTLETLAALPDDAKQALKAALQTLDISATEAAISNIREDFPEIADGLEQLVLEFRFNDLLDETRKLDI